MKRAYDIEKTEKGYIVKVNDNGHCTMCEFKDGKWQNCYFQTYEEALDAKQRYNEMWTD